MKNTLTLILFAFQISLPAQEIQPLWVRTEPTDGSLGLGKLPIVLVDASHNVIVCGDTYSPGPVTGFVTTKYDSGGNQLWQRKHDTFATDLITAAVVDNTGAVYVGGNSTNPFTNATQFIVFKYSSAGDTLWQYSYDNLPSATTYLSTLLLDSVQNLLVFGHFYDSPSIESGLLTVKLSPSGSNIWEAVHDEGDYGYTGLEARMVDNRFVFWGHNGSQEGIRFFVWQIASDGQTISIAPTQSYSDYFWIGYHVDHSGNLYIGDNDGEYKVTKFTTDGTTDWVYHKPLAVVSPNIIPAYLYSIATTSIGEVYISGGFRWADTLGMIGLTSKLNASGELVWEHQFNPTEFEHISPYKSDWIKDDLLLVTGLASVSIDSNFYEYYLAFYDKNGYVQAGISDIAGRRNWPASIVPDGEMFYIAGLSEPTIFLSEPRKQFLCKYALGDIVGTISPNLGTRTAGQLSISPNPFCDRFRVSVNHVGEGSQGMLEVSNYEGRVLFRQKVSLIAGVNNFDIDVLRDLPTGAYGVSLITLADIYTGRVVRAR